MSDVVCGAEAKGYTWKYAAVRVRSEDGLRAVSRSYVLLSTEFQHPRAKLVPGTERAWRVAPDFAGSVPQAADLFGDCALPAGVTEIDLSAVPDAPLVTVTVTIPAPATGKRSRSPEPEGAGASKVLDTVEMCHSRAPAFYMREVTSRTLRQSDTREMVAEMIDAAAPRAGGPVAAGTAEWAADYFDALLPLFFEPPRVECLDGGVWAVRESGKFGYFLRVEHGTLRVWQMFGQGLPDIPRDTAHGFKGEAERFCLYE